MGEKSADTQRDGEGPCAIFRCFDNWQFLQYEPVQTYLTIFDVRRFTHVMVSVRV